MQPEVKYYADKQAGGITGWWWIETDTGAWYGPKEDWLTSHKLKIQQHVHNFDCVIQAGGNQGMYAKLLSRMFRVVYTFEPDPLNFRALVLNCVEDNIIKMQSALGSTSSFTSLIRNSMQNTGMHQVRMSDSGFIPLIALDDLPFKKVDLLMLDVEGYEEEVIRGAKYIITTHKPVIIAENPRDSLNNILEEMGYQQVDTSVRDGVYKYMSNDMDISR